MSPTDQALERARGHLRAGAIAEAEAICRQVLAGGSSHPVAARLLAEAAERRGDLNQAMAWLRSAGVGVPGDADLWFRLGNTLYRAGRFIDAETCYREVATVRPDQAEVWGNLGAAVADQGRHQEAIAFYEQALRLNPDQVEARFNLTNSLRELGRLDEALVQGREVLNRRPDFPEAHLNLGTVLLRQRDLAAAQARFRQALSLRPDSAQAWTNLGLSLAEQGRPDEALICYERSLRHRPDDPDAHRNRALAWLLLGNLAQGFPEYEWRWRCSDFSPMPIPQPRWDGSPRPGAVLVLYTEQGLGDTLQFVRYAELARSRVGAVWLVAPERLIPLLSRCRGLDRLAPFGSVLQDFDFHAPLMSLPAMLGTSRASVPATVPYLRADPERVASWASELATLSGFRVGIAWEADPKGYRGQERSIPLSEFEPLARIPAVRLISLQKGPAREPVATLANRFEVLDLADRLDQDGGAFEDTAAVMLGLDLVITCDTSIAHLAGGLGVPGWVALPHVPDWRWMLERPDSPWYPSLRLYRQAVPGDWSHPFQTMARDLANRPLAPGA